MDNGTPTLFFDSVALADTQHELSELKAQLATLQQEHADVTAERDVALDELEKRREKIKAIDAALQAAGQEDEFGVPVWDWSRSTYEENIAFIAKQRNDAQRELAALKAERDALKAALQTIQSHAEDGLGEWLGVHFDHVPSDLDEYYFIRQIAADALNAEVVKE